MIIQTQYKYFSESNAPTSIFSHFGAGGGRMTGAVVIASRLWTSKKVSYSTDVSTSMSEAESRGQARAFRPVSLSFRDEGDVRVAEEKGTSWQEIEEDPLAEGEGAPGRGESGSQRASQLGGVCQTEIV
jgi:hypothetical protein